MSESPYPEHERVVMRRSAHGWAEEIEARLAELEVSTVLAPTVADLADATGCTIDTAILNLKAALRPPT